MNKKNAHKFLPIVQALIDGKQIQYKQGCKDNSYWVDFEHDEEIGFYDDPEDYRIKPEPRTFEMHINEKGVMYPVASYPLTMNGFERIKVQEVLE
jgi:hypothetical protein